MKIVRIGNDISVHWKIFTEDDQFNLSDRDIKIYLTNAFERTEIKEFSVSENNIQFTFYGKDQKYLGKYSLQLCINENAEGMITTDLCDFIRLVPCTCNVGSSEEVPNIEVESVTLETELDFQIIVDAELSETSANPVENRVITAELKNKANIDEIPTKLSQLEIDIEIETEGDSPFEKGNAEGSAVLKGNEANGEYSLAVGLGTTADGYCSHVEGEASVDPDTTREDTQCGIATGRASHSEGTSAANGDYSHAEGYQTHATAIASHAEGYQTDARGSHSHSEGRITKARGGNSHAEGQNTIAEGAQSHAEGWSTTAKGNNSHSEGKDTTAIGNNSHVEGLENIAEGAFSHSEGKKTYAKGEGSHAEGFGTIAKNSSEHAEGTYNKSNANTIHSVGIGVEGARKNAHEITNDGKHFIYGIGGFDGTNPDKANDVALQFTELSAEVSGLSEKIDNLPSGAEVFVAQKNITTLAEIAEAVSKGKIVTCVDNNIYYSMSIYRPNDVCIFSADEGGYHYVLKCNIFNKWSSVLLNASHELKTLDNGNAQITIAGKSAEVATPQYVENLLGTIINGDY